MSQDLIYEVKDRVGYIAINRPEQRNAITPEAISLFLK
jgi:1,4-dihydroxy-2-naphthoyl-CoA synthase